MSPAPLVLVAVRHCALGSLASAKRSPKLKDDDVCLSASTGPADKLTPHLLGTLRTVACRLQRVKLGHSSTAPSFFHHRFVQMTVTVLVGLKLDT